MLIFDFANLEPDHQKFVKQLEEMGEEVVAANVFSEQWGPKKELAKGWLEQRRRQREINESEARIAASEASKEAAEVAKRTVEATEKAANWTKWAAIFTAVAAIATAAQAWVSWAQKDITQPTSQSPSQTDSPKPKQ